MNKNKAKHKTEEGLMNEIESLVASSYTHITYIDKKHT